MRILLVSVNSHTPRLPEPRKHPRQQRSRDLVAGILDEAARIFNERGYTATTTNHIAEAAEVSVGSLYQYFPNKDAILVALADRHIVEATRTLTILTADLHRTEPAPRELAMIVVDALVAFHQHDRLHQLLWHSPRTPALSTRLDQLTDAMTSELATHLERYGHPAALARIRARLVVTALDTWIHTNKLTKVTKQALRDLTAGMLTIP